MKVFISWSGDRSKTVAVALAEFIDSTIQAVEPWVSAKGIESGERWSDRIGEELQDTNYGILCLTSGNLHSDWILFEAGALAKSMGKARVCPYLVEVGKTDLPAGPLTQFQAKYANEAETRELIDDMNKALPAGERRSSEQLDKAFSKFWEDLEALLGDLPPETDKPVRKMDDKVDEILEVVRRLDRGQKESVFLEDPNTPIANTYARYLRNLSAHGSGSDLPTGDQLHAELMKRAGEDRHLRDWLRFGDWILGHSGARDSDDQDEDSNDTKDDD